MRIYRIFEEIEQIELYVVHYPDEDQDEYDRLFSCWSDMDYLRAFAGENGVEDVYSFIEEVLRDAGQFERIFFDYKDDPGALAMLFRPLSDANLELGAELKLKKGKLIRNRLRLYAIQLEDECYLITGGAIKMSQKMQDHPDTANELQKMHMVRMYLKNNGVFDQDSLTDFLKEQHD